MAALILLVALFGLVDPPVDPRYWDPTASGGPLIAEQAAYQVHFYDLSLTIDPVRRHLSGSNVIHARFVLPTQAIAVDLDTTFSVTRVEDASFGEVPFTRHGGRLFFDFGRTVQPGEQLQLAIHYEGYPRVAPNPPWQGGFVWVDRDDGTHWVGVANQGEGADLWWPVKDHPSDRADSMRVAFTVPGGHEAIASGRFVSLTETVDSRTFEWFVSTPINNYSMSVYVGPFVTLEADYTSTAGDPIPFTLHVLPEAEADARRQLPQFVDQMRFMEETFGPYPFRADKYAVIHAPYLGMEHQTAIAYGDRWEDNEFGFDWLHLHELAHEWFANLVSVPDWSHFWVHEGFAMYIEALYAERIGGLEHYHAYMQQRMRPRLVNAQPVVAQTGMDSQSVYFGRTDASDQDVYFKGAWFIHTLRWAFRAEFGEDQGDEAFFRALRRITYPDPQLEEDLTCAACRFATTTDVQVALEREFGRSLDRLFRLYLLQPHLPEVTVHRVGDEVRLEWDTPPAYPLSLPVEVLVGDERMIVRMEDGQASIRVPAEVEVFVDPDNWILRRGN